MKSELKKFNCEQNDWFFFLKFYKNSINIEWSINTYSIILINNIYIIYLLFFFQFLNQSDIVIYVQKWIIIRNRLSNLF